MKTTVEKRLFWFLKEGAEIDLANAPHMDMYVQQVLSRGHTSDIRTLLRIVSPLDLSNSFARIRNFLPPEVKMFWEEWFGDTHKSSEQDTHTF